MDFSTPRHVFVKKLISRINRSGIWAEETKSLQGEEISGWPPAFHSNDLYLRTVEQCIQSFSWGKENMTQEYDCKTLFQHEGHLADLLKQGRIQVSKHS